MTKYLITACPFCGKAPETVGSGDEQRGLMIQCITEGCPNPSVSYYDHKMACLVWNRRMAPALYDGPIYHPNPSEME